MRPMNKRTAIAVTVSVWIAALVSATALAYDLNRTPHLATPHLANVTSQFATPAPVAPTVLAPPAPEVQSVLYIPTITIVGSMRRSMDEPKPAPGADISEMQCTDWRGLDIGSGHVQVCE
jgi:hypothetical protein